MSGVKGALRAPRSGRRPLTPDIREEISSIGGSTSSRRISEGTPAQTLKVSINQQHLTTAMLAAPGQTLPPK
jgi:hypothetical protein